jgi:hypothetical protein
VLTHIRVSSVHRLSHRGKTVTLGIAHHGRLHSDKKSNGRTYYRWIDIKHEIPADIANETLVVSSLMVNMANPKDDILVGMIEAIDLGTTHSPWNQGTYCDTWYTALAHSRREGSRGLLSSSTWIYDGSFAWNRRCWSLESLCRASQER